MSPVLFTIKRFVLRFVEKWNKLPEAVKTAPAGPNRLNKTASCSQGNKATRSKMITGYVGTVW
jgi:hypothetical protein